MNFQRIAQICFLTRIVPRLLRVCVTFSGRGDLDFLRRLVRRIIRLNLVRLLARLIVTGQIGRIRNLFDRLTRGLRVIVRQINRRTIEVTFIRNERVIAVLRIRVSIRRVR